ncbi:molybdenum cofactor guanylyltransferase [Pelomonas sp. CA6]|uniref:molybdenum cofactor guanylyltransferase MobA n=1 Tax=Pelomonas sp. CA6 TaxID=2907999 RepID=UPI001F4BB8BF|nr:molybdenum cofactor guanylyltransferase MobA [Pelomonas sp. CA6]MCH7342430.1 molybdenum cofactor guanylyltransferase [Pelomonas sp. CA6]
MPEREQLTGLVLAGGRGQRMGGADKGLLPLAGQALAAHALRRLAPQVGPCWISANRHLDDYRRLAPRVLSDRLPDQPGPLAGWLSALEQLDTPWLLAVPCDSPLLPADLAQRLGQALRPGDRLAVPVRQDGGEPRVQAAFCLMHRSLAPSLADALARDQRRVQDWLRQQNARFVPFDQPGDAEAFANANTPEELARLEALLTTAPAAAQQGSDHG